MDAVPVKIHNFAAVDVFEIDAFGIDNHIEAGSGHGLVQEIPAVFLQDLQRFRTQMGLLPAAPLVGQVDIPFRLEIGSNLHAGNLLGPASR